MTGDQCEVILDQIRELNRKMNSLLELANELVELNRPRLVNQTASDAWNNVPKDYPEPPAPVQPERKRRRPK